MHRRLSRQCGALLLFVTALWCAPDRLRAQQATHAFGFEGVPEIVTGEPGQTVTFDAFVTLTSANNAGGEGASAWTLSLTAEGARIVAVSTAGLRVSTNQGERELVMPQVQFAFAELATRGDPPESGAVSGVILNAITGTRLLPEGTVRLAVVTVEVTIPAEGGDCSRPRLLFRDGFTGSGLPQNNRITVAGATLTPTAPPTTVILACELPTLDPGGTVNVSLAPAARRAWVRFRAPARQSAIIRLSSDRPESSNELYLRWGALARPAQSDLAATVSGQPGQTLVVPFVQNRTGYLLVRATALSAQEEVTLQAETVQLFVSSTSTRRGAAGAEEVSTAVAGTGFLRGETLFRLVKTGGAGSIAAQSTVIVSSQRAELAFDLRGATPGPYDLIAENPTSSQISTLPQAFEVVATTRGPIVRAELVVPDLFRLSRPGRITLRYENIGDREIPAPLFRVRCTNCPEGENLLGLESEGLLRPGSLQVLGIDPVGVAGRLPPGVRVEMPISFQNDREGGGDPAVDFAVEIFSPTSGEFIGWDTLQDAPGWQTDPAWDEVWPGLSATLSPTWSGYRVDLGRLATRIARRRLNGASVDALFRFAARQALGWPHQAIVGAVRLETSGEPLRGTVVAALRPGSGDEEVVVSRTITDSQGVFVLDCLPGGQSYRIRVADHDVGDVLVPVPADESQDVLGLELLASPADDVPGIGDETCDRLEPTRLAMEPGEEPELFRTLGEDGGELIQPIDPNEKDGPVGEGDGEVLPGAQLEYTIYFENLPVATASAQTVTIEDQLPPQLDFQSFRARQAVIGTNPPIALDFDLSGLSPGDDPPCRRRVVVDLRGTVIQEETRWSGVEILCDYDPATGHALWTFNTVDPLTEQRPPLADPAGFLPPNTEEVRPNGEGHVSFTVNARTDANPGVAIVNQAAIVFDSLNAIVTNEWVNSIRVEDSLRKPGFPFPVDACMLQVDPSTTLSWQAVEGAQEYDVFIWPQGEPEPSEPTASGIEENGLNLDSEILEHGTIYNWKVTVHDDENNTVEGDTWCFSTTVEPPPAPGQPGSPSPADGAVNVPTVPVLTWQAPTPQASAYELFLWIAPGPEPTRPVARSLGETSFALPVELAMETEFNWRVVALGPGGETAGEVWSFTTRGNAPLFLRGDVDGNGILELTDPVNNLSFQFLGEYVPGCLDALDFDDNGLIELTDPVNNLGHQFLGDPPPPAPGSSFCGEDPTPDGDGDLGCKDFPETSCP